MAEMSQRAYDEDLAAAREDARRQERADAVAYFMAMYREDPDEWWSAKSVADAIAAGQHVGASPAQNGIGPGSKDRA